MNSNDVHDEHGIDVDESKVSPPEEVLGLLTDLN